MTAKRAMRTAQWVVSFYALLIAHCPLVQATATLEEQAQAAWQTRDKPGHTVTALQLWRLAARAEPKRPDLWINLAKALGKGVRNTSSSRDRKEWANEAREAAEQAVRLAPDNPEAYTVYGEALGQWANVHKGIPSLSAVRKAMDALQTAITLDPKHAYAHMLLAEFYRQSPRFFSIGDKHKALEQARLAVQYGPGYAINHLALARANLDLGMKEEGIAELQKIISLSPPADAIPETRADQETAQGMLRSLGVSPQVPCGEEGGACVGQP